MRNSQKKISNAKLTMYKIIIHHDQVGFTPGIQGWFNIKKNELM